MTLSEWLTQNDLSTEDAAKLFDVTVRVIERWLDTGVPRSRRPTVLARTKGAVSFNDMLHVGDEAVLRVRRLLLELNDFRIRRVDKGDRVTLQFYLKDLEWVLDYLIGRAPNDE